MKKRSIGKTTSLILSLLLALSLPSQAAPPQRIAMDKTVRKGVLPNGMTYYIRHNDQTAGVADFYFAQKVGSILEEPQQRGLAHFLEHMAFNGTQNFPGDSLRPGIVAWCERVGIKFGANLNAYTSVDQTVYNISDAPVKREGIVDSCLLILHDWSHSLLLSDEEIDKERGVIHEEWRSRRIGMAMQRLAERAMPVIYAGSKYADCMPIGDMDIVAHFPHQTLRDYYHRWYRPDLQAVIVVGDIDVDRIEQKIKQIFSTISMPEQPRQRIYYPVIDNERMIVHTDVDKEQPTVNFTLYMKRDVTPREQRNTVDTYADDYKTSIVRMAINDRLEALSRAADAPFISASVRDGHFFMAATKDVFEVSGVLKEDRVEQGIRIIVGEVERARTHGLTAQELKRGKAEMMSFAESGFNDRDKRRNGEFVEACVDNFLEDEPIIDPVQELELVKRLDARVTLKDINCMARDIIIDRNQVITLFGPEKPGFALPSKQTVEQIVSQAQTARYAPYREKSTPGRLIDKLPKPGTIVAEQPYKYGYTELVLSNGLRVYVRPTTFEADEVNFKLFSKGGKNLYPDSEMPNLTYLISGATIGGAGRFDDLMLEKMLAGKTVSVNPYIDDETEGIKGSSSVKDMPTLFELAYLYFTQPRKDKQAFRNLMQQQEAFLANAAVNPMIAYNDSLHAIAYGSRRMESMTKERLGQVNYDRIMQIYHERFDNAADFRLIITGNVDMARLRTCLCRYMAVLPTNGTQEQVGKLGPNIVDGRKVNHFCKPQKTPSATTTILIKGRMAYTDRNEQLLDATAQLLRMVYTDKIREEKGGTYSVQVSSSIQNQPYDEALLRIAFQTDPEKYEQLMPIVYGVLSDMAENGPSQQDLDKVKAYEMKTYEQVLRMNNYWEYVIYNDLYSGVDVDTRFRDIATRMTADDVRSVLKSLLQQHNCIQVTMTSN